MPCADIGLIGLAVMGENLVMNMESKGFTVAVYNRTRQKTEAFVNGRASGKNKISSWKNSRTWKPWSNQRKYRRRI